MVPHAAPLQPAPKTLQVTAVFELPETVVVNCSVAPSDTVALLGLTCTTTPVAATTLSVAVALVALPTRLVTTTAKRARLSEAVVGGVV
jgi:hypothetical protein